MADAVPIELALQGGGAHGAYTWGVLDRLLEEPRIEIASISAASAGAMNAAVLGQRLCERGWSSRGPGGRAGGVALLLEGDRRPCPA